MRSLPVLGLSTDEYARDPELVLARLRAHSEIALSERGYEVLTYALCSSLSRDRRLHADHMALVREVGLPAGPVWDFKQRMILSTRGDAHTRLRIPLARYFGPPAAAGMTPIVRRIIDDLLAPLAPGEPADLLAVCGMIPAALYCHWVAAPPGDAALVARWSAQVLRLFSREPGSVGDVVQGYGELFAYVSERIAERRRAMGDDMLSDLIREADQGRLSPDELHDQVVMLLEASTDNTAQQMAICLALLLEHPAQWRLLLADPDLIPGAVEEGMRYETRTRQIERFASSDVEVAGVQIGRGERVVLNIASAHRDSSVYPRPDQYDIRRQDPARPLTFGGGAYACVGSAVARLEIAEFIRAIAARFPAAELAVPALRRGNPYVHEVLRLPVRLG
jgi:cytochrome P450